MKKRVLSIVALVIILSFFIGCEVPTNSPDEPPEETVEDVVEQETAEKVELPVINIPRVYRVVTRCAESEYAPGYDMMIEYDNDTLEIAYSVSTEYGSWLVYTCENGSYMNLCIGNEVCNYYTESISPIADEDVATQINGIMDTIKNGEYIGENDEMYIFESNQPFKYILDSRYVFENRLDQNNSVQNITTQIGVKKDNDRPYLIQGFEKDVKRYNSEIKSLAQLSYNESSFANSVIVNQEIFDRIFTKFQYDLSRIKSQNDFDSFVNSRAADSYTLDIHYLQFIYPSVPVEQIEIIIKNN